MICGIRIWWSRWIERMPLSKRSELQVAPTTQHDSSAGGPSSFRCIGRGNRRVPSIPSGFGGAWGAPELMPTFFYKNQPRASPDGLTLWTIRYVSGPFLRRGSRRRLHVPKQNHATAPDLRVEWRCENAERARGAIHRVCVSFDGNEAGAATRARRSFTSGCITVTLRQLRRCHSHSSKHAHESAAQQNGRKQHVLHPPAQLLIWRYS